MQARRVRRDSEQALRRKDRNQDKRRIEKSIMIYDSLRTSMYHNAFLNEFSLCLQRNAGAVDKLR